LLSHRVTGNALTDLLVVVGPKDHPADVPAKVFVRCRYRLLKLLIAIVIGNYLPMKLRTLQKL
jgi:hypothetical protein